MAALINNSLYSYIFFNNQLIRVENFSKNHLTSKKSNILQLSESLLKLKTMIHNLRNCIHTRESPIHSEIN